MNLALLTNESLLALPGSDDDKSSIWWVTLKALRYVGFHADVMGKGIAIFIRGDGVIVRDNDSRIETFLYDAKSVRVFAQGTSDSLGRFGKKAFSLELYHERRSYSPIYGLVPVDNDPAELCRRYMFSLRELVTETKLPELEVKLKLN